METISPARRVGDEIRAHLARRRMSQSQLGSLLGLSQTAVSRRLLGEVPFDIDELTAVADALGIDVRDLIAQDAA